MQTDVEEDGPSIGETRICCGQTITTKASARKRSLPLAKIVVFRTLFLSAGCAPLLHMREPHNVFHLAIPCRDLDETVAFYESALGAKLCRRYEDRVTFNFFGDQLVCHLSPECVDRDAKLDPYPRHFGITFREEADFLDLAERVKSRGLQFYGPMSSRFAGLPEEHLTFFLLDPSQNFLEFKFYRSPEMMY